jgi:hypothetical protein
MWTLVISLLIAGQVHAFRADHGLTIDDCFAAFNAVEVTGDIVAVGCELEALEQ